MDHPPYSLTVTEAARYFGFAPKTFYNWISMGRLHRGIHYLKVGAKPVIIRDAFIKFMETEDGGHGDQGR